ncbi:hypothetical protein CJF43_13070 [Pseudomonas fragi]|uniref:Uncharacterized protein n=1 Tax=Pseudomonas fragi TaxID=296 RepID=A0A266LT68_PSEFR|nr:hypothetical protein CJF43_13070 [Pseudomonas fragi]
MSGLTSEVECAGRIRKERLFFYCVEHFNTALQTRTVFIRHIANARFLLDFRVVHRCITTRRYRGHNGGLRSIKAITD